MDGLLDQISKLLVAMAPDTQGINRYRYSYNLSCMEELVEALTFAHYLKTQSLISYTQLSSDIDDLARRGAATAPEDVIKAQADANMPETATDNTATRAADIAADPDIEAKGVPVVETTELDYLYGVFDLTGEMMRFATTSTALTRTMAAANDGDASDRPRTILQDMQDLRSFIEMLPQKHTKQWTQKLQVLRQSVRKVELIGYGMVVRGGERGEGWVPDAEVDDGLEE